MQQSSEFRIILTIFVFQGESSKMMGFEELRNQFFTLFSLFLVSGKG